MSILRFLGSCELLLPYRGGTQCELLMLDLNVHTSAVDRRTEPLNQMDLCAALCDILSLCESNGTLLRSLPLFALWLRVILACFVYGASQRPLGALVWARHTHP